MLTLQADEPSKMNWWVDLSFAVLPNMQIHTGEVLLLVAGRFTGHPRNRN